MFRYKRCDTGKLPIAEVVRSLQEQQPANILTNEAWELVQEFSLKGPSQEIKMDRKMPENNIFTGHEFLNKIFRGMFFFFNVQITGIATRLPYTGRF